MTYQKVPLLSYQLHLQRPYDFVVHVRKVRNVGHIEPTVFEITADGVQKLYTPSISDMDIIVNHWTAVYYIF